MTIHKTIVAVVGVLALVGEAIADGNVDPAEAGSIVTGVLIAFGVWAIPNRQKGTTDGQV